MDGSALERLTVELAREVRSRFYGKYRGIVEDNGDTQNVGRIRVKVPAVYGDEVSPWALPCAPYAGDNIGLYTVPPPGAGVWVEFEGGDVNLPIWSGMWWGSNQLPKDEAQADTGPKKKLLRSEKGLMVVLDDDAEVVTLSDANGNNLLKIKVQEGNVRVQAQSKVVVEAPQIELVDGASHPLVFGDDLLTYLNQLVTLYSSHVHPGETALGIPVTPAPPQPIFPSAQPSLLSVKVKTG